MFVESSDQEHALPDKNTYGYALSVFHSLRDDRIGYLGAPCNRLVKYGDFYFYDKSQAGGRRTQHLQYRVSESQRQTVRALIEKIPS